MDSFIIVHNQTRSPRYPNHDPRDGKIVDRGFVVDDISVNGRFEDLGFRAGTFVIQHRAKSFDVLEFGSQTSSNHVVAARHAFNAVARQVCVGLVRA